MKNNKMIQPKRTGDTQYGKQPLGHPFQVGETYANRQGNYEVMEIAPPKITVRYEDGGLLVADIAVLARIWDNLHSPEELPEPSPRPRAAARPSSAQPRVSGQRRSARD